MRALTIDGETTEDGFSLVKLRGRFTVRDSLVLKDVLDTLGGEGKKVILIDCAELTHINSSAIGVLVAAKTTLGQEGGYLGLIAPNSVIREVFRLTGVDLILPIALNIQECRAEIEGRAASSK